MTADKWVVLVREGWADISSLFSLLQHALVAFAIYRFCRVGDVGWGRISDGDRRALLCRSPVGDNPPLGAAIVRSGRG